MFNVFLSLGVIAGIGSVLRYIFPEIDIESFRRSINKLVLYIILPSLIFNIVYNTKIGAEFFQIPVVAIGGISAALSLAAFLFAFIKIDKKTKGALILASAFSNVTYLGLPVLQGIFSDIPEKIAVVSVLYEVSTTPFLLTIGASIALYYGNKTNLKLKDMAKRVFQLPPLWALAISIILNILNIPLPDFVLQTTKLLAATTSGLMILSLGMALKFKRIHNIKNIVIVGAIQLFFIPVVAFFIGKFIGMQQPFFEASVIEAAMPTQLLTLVIADEFDLDTEILAMTIFVLTVSSVLTIPFIRYLLFS